MRFFIITFISILITIKSYSQILLTGFVIDSIGNSLTGANIKDLSNKRNTTVTNIDGKFNIQLKSDSSLIEISLLGFKSKIVKVDTVDKNNFKCTLFTSNEHLSDIIVIAPNPPAIEFGYLGYFTNNPASFHLSYTSRASIFQTYINYGIKGNFFDFEIGPYRLGKDKTRSYLRPFLKGQINNSISRMIFCNEFGLIGLNADLDVGIGTDSKDLQPNRLVYLTGFRKNLNLPMPIFITFFKLDFIYNKDFIDYIGSLYLELYNREYKKFTFGVGYQSIFKNKDLLLELSYKYYF